MGSGHILALCCLSCFLLPSLVLQGCGIFSPYWINDKNNTSDCYRGVIYNFGCSDGIGGLGDTILVLQVTSFAIILSTAISCIGFICSIRNIDDDDDDDDDDKEDTKDDVGCCAMLGACMICLYPVAGVLGFSGCIVIIADFGGYEKGWAFYVSVAASCFEMLKLVVCCCAVCMTDTKDSENNGGSSAQEPGSKRRVMDEVLEHQESIFSLTETVLEIFHIS